MTREAVIFGISGTVFGILIGWIVGTRYAGGRPAGTAAVVAQQAPALPGEQAPPPIDLQRVSALEQRAKAQPSDAAVRTELGNLYSDSQRPDLAIPWYEASLKVNPKDVNVSTDLAKCYYEVQQPDKALAQIDHSLAINPRHPTTLLNQGIIRAFGKQDLDGAMQSWENVLKVAPDSPEATRARMGLESLKANHAADIAAPAKGTGTGRGGRGQ